MSDIANGWLWLGFIVFVFVALCADTFFLGKKYGPHLSVRVALFWSLVFIFCTLFFNGVLWVYLYMTHGVAIANEKSLDFLTGYLIEKSLSTDNLFAFYMIFEQLQIPVASQQRVFAYGIWSAIILRLLVIFFFIWLVEHFHGVLYLMGIFLLLTGIHMLFMHQHKENSTLVRLLNWLKHHLRITPLQGEKFFVKKNQLWFATPLLVALIFIEITDLVFAFESIPAIFAITTDPFLVWSSNIFAILGLRSMYFLLVGMVERLYLLKYAMALILVFVGIKMVIVPWIKIPVGISLAIIAGILLIFTVLSLKRSSTK